MHKVINNIHGAIIKSCGDFEFEVIYPDSCDFFGSHFPGNPVVPGVILLDTLYNILFENGFNSFKRINKARFYKTVKPNEMIRVSFSNIQENDEKLRCVVRYKKHKVMNCYFLINR